MGCVATPLWPSVGVKPNTPKVGDLESSGTPECLGFDSKVQNTSNWSVLGVIGKVLKRRYRKWPRIGHLDIYNPSYGQKEGPGVKLAVWLPTTKSRESTSSRPPNWKCDTLLERSRRGLQVWFRPRCDQTLQSGVMSSQSSGTPTGTISGQFRDSNLGVPGKSAIWVQVRRSGTEYTIGRMVVAPPESGPWCVLWSKVPVACPNTQGVPECKLTTLWFVLDAESSLIY
jgi:hypothetical protein